MIYSEKFSTTRRIWIVSLLLLLLSGIFPSVLPLAIAQVPPTPVPVSYTAATDTIYIGTNYSVADPLQAPYVGYPSHPLAPKSPITIPELDLALTTLGFPDLLTNDSSVWTLKANIIISQTARLNVMSDTVSVLRLDSDPLSTRARKLTSIIARGGYLNIQGDVAPAPRIQIFSWDPASPDLQGRDTNYADGRSYLLADVGGRMDIINAEISYLGHLAGEESGLSWRKMAMPGNPTDINYIQTGATGSILNSDIHHNYFGQYSYEAFGLIIKNNEFHNNDFYGIDPHDYSTHFEVAYNKVYNNGKHGIIFSRHCTLNSIHDNEVYGNAEHGIMLDRGTNNNQIINNNVYNNQDGVAIFQSSNNLIKGNNLHDNNRGVRINATYDTNDVFDGVSTNNIVEQNIIQNNTQYGIYLYERGDKNNIISNQISGTGNSALYIKTGSNVIEGNTISENLGYGINIIGGAYITPPLGGPAYVSPQSQPGLENVIRGNTITDNAGMGIQVQVGTNTVIGTLDPDNNPQMGNVISTNGSYGVSLSDNTINTKLIGNSIHGNGANGNTLGTVVEGIRVRGIGTLNNMISRNSITANAKGGIVLSDGGNANIAAPIITSAPEATTVTGSALANAIVEIYRDSNGQGNIYKGQTTVNTNGEWSFTLPAGDNPQEGFISALVIDGTGNTSIFTANIPSNLRASYSIGKRFLKAGVESGLTIFVNGLGANVTLADIQAAVQVISPTVNLLENQGNGIWQANASIFLNAGVTLSLTKDTVKWLKLRSQGSSIAFASAEPSNYNYQSFTTLRTSSGTIIIDGVRITSWDPNTNDYDRDITNGRSYILAKYNARMDISNAELSYLGSADGESYGIAWRDINDTDTPDQMRTRVTGSVLNSIFSYNYYGIYTFQAENMVFRNNKFHNNIGYGFDPHDFSHHFTVENNEAFANGNHGFIISRGCNNFVIRNNKSYNNTYSVSNEDRNAHGFMIDPGSPNSQFAQQPSFDNVIENNDAWGNDGYGLRMVGSLRNTVRGNRFTGNLQGITLEQGSESNIIENNIISNSTLYGIYVMSGSDINTLKGNIISRSGKHGMYIKAGNNAIVGNTLTDNGTVTPAGPVGAGLAFLPDLPSTTLTDMVVPGGASIASADVTLLSDYSFTTALQGNLVQSNSIAGNADDGIELKGASNTLITGNHISNNGTHGIYISEYEGIGAIGNNIIENTIWANKGYGIRANGSHSSANLWSQNQVSANTTGGIITTGGANGGIMPPVIVTIAPTQVSGTTIPNAKVEIFTDNGGQGLYFEGTTIADASGQFSFKASQSWRGGIVNATATDTQGNSSGFAIQQGTYMIFLPTIQK